MYVYCAYPAMSDKLELTPHPIRYSNMAESTLRAWYNDIVYSILIYEHTLSYKNVVIKFRAQGVFLE